MDETIGSRGGRNDRRRTLIITNNQKKKIKERYQKKKDERIKKLEKEVKNIQLASLFVAVPISITGNVFETLLHLRDEEKNEREEAKGLQTEELHQQEKLELKETTEYIEDYQLNDRTFKDKGYPRTIEGKFVLPPKIKLVEPPKEATAKITLDNPKQQESSKQDQKAPVSISPIPIAPATNELERLQDKKIVEKYEEKLKEVKQELTDIVFEYNVISKNATEMVNTKDAEDILAQLNTIIKKLEELKRRIKAEVTNSEGEVYLTSLVDGYMEDFKNKKTVDWVKDSDLYIMLESKLEEVKGKAEILNADVEEKKTDLALDEDKIQQLKDEYFNYDNFNNQLLTIQYEQDYLLKDLEEKVKNSVSITEQVTYKVEFLNRQSKRMLGLLSALMLVPGNRSAKALATGTAAYMLFMKNLLNPKLRKKKYRTIKVTDYSKEIERGIASLEDVLSTLNKTSTKLEEMINTLEHDFSDYIKDVPEIKELLSNLNQLLDNIKEKEEQLERTKQNQEQLLQKNNEKVKTLERTEVM